MAPGIEPDRRALMDEWRSANDHVLELEQHERGWTDAPTLDPLPPEFAPLQAQVLADPIFQRSFAVVPTTIAMVNLTGWSCSRSILTWTMYGALKMTLVRRQLQKLYSDYVYHLTILSHLYSLCALLLEMFTYSNHLLKTLDSAKQPCSAAIKFHHIRHKGQYPAY
jgi:hypothetical protein